MDTVPLSKGDKARAIGRLFDQNRDGDAYRAIEPARRFCDECLPVDQSTRGPRVCARHK